MLLSALGKYVNKGKFLVWRRISLILILVFTCVPIFFLSRLDVDTSYIRIRLTENQKQKCWLKYKQKSKRSFWEIKRKGLLFWHDLQVREHSLWQEPETHSEMGKWHKVFKDSSYKGATNKRDRLLDKLTSFIFWLVGFWDKHKEWHIVTYDQAFISVLVSLEVCRTRRFLVKQFGTGMLLIDSTGRMIYQTAHSVQGPCLFCGQFCSLKNKFIPRKQFHSPNSKISECWAINYGVKVLINCQEAYHDRLVDNKEQLFSIQSNLLITFFHYNLTWYVYLMIFWGIKAHPRVLEDEGQLVQVAQKKGNNCRLY